MSFNSRLYNDMSHYQPTQRPPQGQQHETVQRLWQTEEQLKETKSELDDVVSQRSRTPMASQRLLQQQAATIEKLEAKIAVLEGRVDQYNIDLHNLGIRDRQQRETIRIQSEEVSKCPNHPASKYETSPLRLPSQYGTQPAKGQDIVPADYFVPSQPPGHGSGFPHGSQYGQRPQISHESQQMNSKQSIDYCPDQQRPTYPQRQYCQPAKPGHPSADRTKWGDIISRAPQQNQERALVRRDETAFTPSTQGRQGPSELGSPIGQMSRLSIQDNPRASSSIFDTPSRQERRAVVQKAQREAYPGDYDGVRTPESNASGGSSGNPRAPNTSPARDDSIVSSGFKKVEGIPKGPVPTMPKEDRMRAAFLSFFDKLVLFSYNHVNIPNPQADSVISKGFKDHLIQIGGQKTAWSLISHTNSRYFVVARIMFDWIEREVFKEEAFSGLHEESDNAIRQTKLQLYSNTPPAVRSVWLREIANRFVNIRKSVKSQIWENFVSQRSNKQAYELWEHIRPLKHVSTTHDWVEMLELMREAHRLAELMCCEPINFSFEYPVVNELFKQQSHVKIGPDYEIWQPDMVEARQGLVKFGATPKVLVRVTNANGTVEYKRLLKPGVLIKLKDPQH